MTVPLKPSALKGKASKLTAEDVRRARDLHARGLLNVREFAQFCGVGTETLRRAVRGETWMEVPFGIVPDGAELELAAKSSAERMMKAIAMEKEKQGAGDAMLKELEAIPASTATNPYNWLKSPTEEA